MFTPSSAWALGRELDAIGLMLNTQRD